MRIVGVEERVDQLPVGIRHGAERIAVLEPPPDAAKPCGPRGIVEHKLDRLGERRGVARLHEDRAGFAVNAQNVPQDGKIVGDDGKPDLSGFDGRKAKSLGAAWKHKTIERGEEYSDFLGRQFAKEAHALGNAHIASQSFEARLVLPRL
jgi:hypothetical protein